MLTRVDIENYRGFKSYRMDGLAQVNLLVGKNNSGKTALAEAIHLVTAGGDPTVLSEAALRRGEMTASDDSSRLFPDLTHFFHGHQIAAGSSFSLRCDNGYPALTVRLVPILEQLSLFPDVDSPAGGSYADEEFETHPTYGVVVEGAIGFGGGARDLALSERGALIFNPRARGRQSVGISEVPVRPTLFVPTDSVPPRRLSQMWRQAILDSNQQEVIMAMRLVADSIREIVVLPSDSPQRSMPTSRDWYVLTTEFKKPIPLGSFGDGVRRLMSLALSLSRVGGGTLLVDEIDTGLHYSVMADMWKLVVKKSIESNVQVFATTHSWDCIEGLSQLCQLEPDLMSKVAIHKIDQAISHSVAFSGESIVRMVKSDMDPR